MWLLLGKRLEIKKSLGLAVFLANLTLFLFVFCLPIRAATYRWNQDDWAGGADILNTAKHETDQNGWTKYFSKDESLTLNSGSISLSSLSESLTHNSSVGFTDGSLTNVEFSGNNLQLKKNSGNQQIVTGNYHTCALKTDGTVWCWGQSSSGKLGIGATGDRTTLVQVVGLGGSGNLTDISQITAGSNHTCAVKTDGTAWCWGENGDGQLGNNSTTDKSTPVQVLGLGGSGTLTDVSQIAGGNEHSCALKTDGTVWCWGEGSYGRLGVGSTADTRTPVQVLGLGGSGNLTGVAQITVAGWYTCALKTDGAVWCWGHNDFGQLGIGVSGVSGARSTPVQVLGLGGSGTLTDVFQIAAGGSRVCTVKTDGSAWCWGNNTNGELGIGVSGASGARSTPVQVLGLGGSGTLTDVSQIAANSSHVCAVKTDGSAWCWGRNADSQLGNNSTTNNSTPIQVLGPEGAGKLADVSQITAGYTYSCAIKTDGSAWCWGDNDYGQLGNNSIIAKRTPFQVVGLGGVNGTSKLTDVSQITGGYSHTCAVKTDGTVWCWGLNADGQLGIGTTIIKRTPVQVFDFDGIDNLTDVSQITAGSYHTCALKTEGTVWCWGRNNLGQLGIGTTSSENTPVQVLGLDGSGNLTGVSQITGGGGSSTCALKTDGTVWCWGYNFSGQLGNNSGTDKRTPVQVLGVGGSGNLTEVAQIIAGTSHTCAVKNEGTVWCWGNNSFGQLGNNSATVKLTPIQVLGLGASGNLTDVSQITAGSYHNCVIKTDDTVWCWGYNDYGQLGINSTSDKRTPVQVLGLGASGNLTDVSQITAGSYFTCAIKNDDNTAWCWGQNDYSQLGVNNNINKLVPIIVFNSIGWELRLSGYYSSGTFLSPIINLNGKNINLNSLILAKNLPSSNTSVKIQLKSAETEAGLSSAVWAGPDGADSYYTANSTSPVGISLKPYIQYQAILGTDNEIETPQFSSINLNYQSYYNSGILISSPFDSQADKNLISDISWIKSTPENTSVKYQLRSSPTQNGLTSADWIGPDGSSATYFTNNLGNNIPLSIRDGLNDRWLQYKLILATTDTLFTPTLYDNTLTYVVNAPPTFDQTYQTNGFGITRNETPGIFNFLYKIGDTDTSDASAGNQYKLWPTFQYTLDDGGTWTTIISDQLSGYTTDNPVTLIDGSSYVEAATIWNATSVLPDTFTTMKVRAIIDDHEAANNTAVVTFDTFYFDTKKPTIETVEGGGSGININHNQVTSLAIDKTNSRNVTLYFSATDDSALKFRYSSNSSFTGVEYQDYVASVGFTLSAGDGSKRVYAQFKDIYNNESEVYSDVIQLDTTAPVDPQLFLQDISNPNNNNEARLFLNWPKNTDSDWVNYKVYSSIGTTGDFSLVGTINNINTNYIVQSNLVNTNSYTYKVTNIDDLNNESVGTTISQTVWGNPIDLVPPTITEIEVSNKTTSSATISWTTNEVANASVLYSTDESYSENQPGTGYNRQHSLTLSGLLAGTQYHFKIRVTDPSGNSTDSVEDTFTTNTPDKIGPVITNISISNLSLSRVDISFTTNEISSSFVEYSTTSGFTNGIVFGQNDLSVNHVVSLRSLSPATIYYYKIRSVDSSGNQSVSSEQSFTTPADTSDKTNPVISNTVVSNIKYNTATISFTTDENSSSFIEFGKDADYGRIYGQDNSVTDHSVTLPYDLNPETVYYYRIRIKDISDNETIGLGSSFTTASDPHDLISPIISNVVISEPSQNSVVINWTTNEPATSFIGFGQDTNYAQEQGDSAMTLNHSFVLVGLKPKTIYYFRIKSADPSGNISYDNNSSRGYQLATTNGSNPPTIFANQIRKVATSSAEIYWETNTQTNSYVEYGLNNSYGNLIGSNILDDEHEISLFGLLSGVTYNFRVKSADSTGAESVSQNFTLTTQGVAETVTPEDNDEANNPSEETILDKIKNGTSDLIKKVLDLIPGSSLSEEDFIDKMNTLSPKIVSSPSISSSNIVVDPGDRYPVN